MIDTNSREPHTAAATLGFFGIGKLLEFFSGPEVLHDINTVLATISFVVSITVGTTTLVKTYKRWKKS